MSVAGFWQPFLIYSTLTSKLSNRRPLSNKRFLFNKRPSKMLMHHTPFSIKRLLSNRCPSSQLHEKGANSLQQHSIEVERICISNGLDLILRYL